jgi:hypothetical protein
MKSPMITETGHITNKDRYSDLQVLKSRAGYYVGTVYIEDGFETPGSRDSDYFATQTEAEEYLRAIIEDGAPTRMQP